MPTLFQELVINGSWDFYNFLEWNLAVWITLFFGGPNPANTQVYPPDFKKYVVMCSLISACITVFYVSYLLLYYGAMVMSVR